MLYLDQMKKDKVSKLSAGDEESLSKLSKKKRAQAVDGKPDSSDVENLTRLFELYDQTTGGLLRRMVNDNRMERALNDKSREPDVATAENLSFFMPKDLQEFMEKYYPTIWTNREHLRWFLKTFPMFRR